MKLSLPFLRQICCSRDSNTQPSAFEANALTDYASATARICISWRFWSWSSTIHGQTHTLEHRYPGIVKCNQVWRTYHDQAQFMVKRIPLNFGIQVLLNVTKSEGIWHIMFVIFIHSHQNSRPVTPGVQIHDRPTNGGRGNGEGRVFLLRGQSWAVNRGFDGIVCHVLTSPLHAWSSVTLSTNLWIHYLTCIDNVYQPSYLW